MRNSAEKRLAGLLLAGLVGSLPVAAQDLAFAEQDGLVVVEAESAFEVPMGWAVETTLTGFTGASYLRYAANDQFNNPGVDEMVYPVQITNPGLYRFQWRNRITAGSSTTDANDSWLKIDASAFYGLRGNDSIVCPKGFNSAQNDCPSNLDGDGNTTPNGSGSDGWFKVYRSGAGDWIWSTNTSDNDAHRIFARFDEPGVYEVRVSGRSENHAVDRWVLYRDDFADDPLDPDLPESPLELIDALVSDGFEAPPL